MASYSCSSLITISTHVSPAAIYYSIEKAGLLTLFMELFSVIGGLYMIMKVLDTLSSLFYCKDNRYTEVNTGSELEMT